MKMILRALILALACASALATLTAATAGDEDCALYLSGPGRTSAYDYSLNLLRGNFAYEGQHTCITYEAINQAYLEARKRILVAQPKGDWTPEDYASVGELVLDISTNLARRYGLTYEEIEKGLPLVDTSRTLIAEVCPPVFSHVECRAGKYRRLDGLCNNLQHPTWGSTNVPFQRLIGPLFADGINSPRIAHTGRDLPLSRVVSRTIHPDEGFHDHAGTVMVIAWGQFMDHDYTLTATPLDPRNRNDPEECCKRPQHLKHPYCNEIRIPDDDYFYRLFGVKCIDFVRAFPSPRPGCRLGSRIPFNTLTGVLDGNTVYGVTDKFARKLRTGYGGLLRMNDVFKEYGLRDLLPLKLDIPDEGCTRPNKNMYCFEAGEIRVNEQLVLTVMHTLMAREHNRVAKGLAEVNPHWDDETLYQEARRINIAEIQHITYNEFLPILLGKDVMEKFGLVLEKEGYWDGYDVDVNPDVIASFASAAYRFGHSLLPTAIERWSKAHKFIASKRLSDLIRRPYDLYRAGVLDEYIMGLMNQVAQAMDDSITQEVTNHLFKKVGARFGMDLVSFNMQRGREFGIPGYMEFRKFCGLPGADNFQDLFGSMPNETVRKYESIFEHPIDVDLWSGGVSERPLPGSMLGPTFACIIATQFSYSRRGDRFWYELPNQPSSFTPEQLKEVRKARMARVICDNTDIIDTVQLYPMVLPDHELNPRVPCRSGIIPSMDFSKWAEPPQFASPAKQFITDAIVENKTIAETATCGNITNSEACKKLNNSREQSDTEITTETSVIETTTASNATESKQPSSSDTVLKYVYKKDENLNDTKNAGHPKNSLKRRKRDTDADHTTPLIVNYQTSHAGEDSNKNLPLLQNYEIFPPAPDLRLLPKIKQNYIQPANLASFDIKTLHDHRAKPIFNDKERDTSNEKSRGTDESKQQDSNEYRDKEPIYDKSSQETDEDEYKNAPLKKKNLYKPYGPVYSEFHPEHNTKPSDEISHQQADFDARSQENNDKSLSEDENLKSNENSEGDDGDAYRKLLKYEASELESKKPVSQEKSRDKSDSDSSEIHDSREDNKEKDYYKARQREREDNSSEDDRSDSREVTDSEESPRNEGYSKQRPEDVSKENIKVDPDGLSHHGDISKETDNKSNESDERTNHSGGNSQESKQKQSYEVHENEPETKKYQGSESDDDRPINSESDYSNPKYTREDSYENDNKSAKDSNENYSKEKYENDYKSRKDSNENYSKEKEKYESDLIRPNSEENSGRSGEDDMKSDPPGSDTPFIINDKLINQGKNSSAPIQDVDLDDFSYERIQLDTKGKVIPATDTHENNSHDSSENLKSNDDKSLTSNEYSGSHEVSHPIQIKVNDGEIKPVVEINSENDSESVEDEDTNKKEDLHDYKSQQIPFNSGEDPINERLNEAIKSPGVKKSVKQEFERIPLNYNHDKNVKQNNDEQNTKENVEPNSNIPENPAQNDDDTTETAVTPPENVQYDENLHFKFSDPVIKLPEIHLPEDILSYNYEPYKPKKNRDNKDFYHYSNEKDSEDEEARKDIEDDQRKNEYFNDEDYHHTRPSGAQKLRKEEDEDEDEDEDLYEKFVRERFGRRQSFEKRSEKLQAQKHVPVDPRLQEQINKVLKRAEATSKQAAKSGDPNAGYLWTLEYNQKL